MRPTDLTGRLSDKTSVSGSKIDRPSLPNNATVKRSEVARQKVAGRQSVDIIRRPEGANSEVDARFYNDKPPGQESKAVKKSEEQTSSSKLDTQVKR